MLMVMVLTLSDVATIDTEDRERIHQLQPPPPNSNASRGMSKAFEPMYDDRAFAGRCI